ncbi:CPBP family intramembrane glutamic endopeptidase [Ornithinimicrobium cavernae]|uniref:CPBP family intramembrane glutamic endopeptidase n=1 Tax=Ornithinimicrobium cavernae TaxID=2666047 RepID=UPI000D699F02|nr:CPBP family intramembrane glutamic endopeptidase [Ornithinimicrobium cavernae]
MTVLVPGERRRLVTETWLVLGVSLGASAVWALLSLVRKLTEPVPLDRQTTAMNTSRAPDRPWLDLAYQLAEILLPLVPVLLALFLLAHHLPPLGASPHRGIGFDLARPVHDTLAGLGLAALIGLPGLGLYLGARELGLNTTISAAGLPEIWWGIPVLVLAAVGNALLEEVVMVGYLFTRWAQAGWTTAAVIVTSALVRGSYHLYQGFGGFVGNVVMGLILGLVYARTRRVMPLVIAHTVLDIVAFVGYALVAPHVTWL